MQGHSDAVVGLAWTPDGTALATACEDRAVRVFSMTDVAARNVTIKRKTLLQAPGDVCWGSPGGEQLVVLTKGLPSLCVHTVYNPVSDLHCTTTWPIGPGAALACRRRPACVLPVQDLLMQRVSSCWTAHLAPWNPLGT